ncbi:MAG: ABC transporter ATP-binding protein [Erysipelothrix sp.]|nr:ABC transporter ATP-binding protein [Erysipelothrix sp.]
MRYMSDANQKLKEPKPKSIKEVIPYLKNLVGKFFYRLFYIFKLVWDTRPWILAAMVFMAIFNGVSPVISAFIGAELLNALLAAYNASVAGLSSGFQWVMTLLILQFGFMFIDDLLNSVNRILIRISNELVSNQVNLKIMHKAKTIDLASFDSPQFYEKFENASREASNRPIQVTNATFTIMSSLISVVSFVTILAAISPFAPLIIIVLSIPSAIINFVYRRKNFQYVRRRSKDRREMNYYSRLMMDKDIVKEVKMFNLADTFIDRYQATYMQYFKGLRRLITVEGMWMILITMITTVVHGGMFLYIARAVSVGTLEIGAYALYTGALKSIARGISSLISTTASIYEGTLFIDNMIEFMNEEQSIKPIITKPRSVPRHQQHEIVFDNVSFHYPGTNHDVIKNLSLTINSDDTVVLVGLNGAGKTTLIKLLTRLYDPSEGVIYLDGHDIREYDVSELYRIFGIIFQDFGKYAVSVKENIAFGEIEKPIKLAMIKEAAHQSNADAFIKDFEQGYQTQLMRIFDEKGQELSIGQWQKIAIARAFYNNSDILILDEPTSALDAIAEQEIYDQFDKLRKDKMTIFVSHRLSSATIANKIVVLEDGKLIELGNHQQLMQAQGHYWKLFTTQAERYISGDI